MSTLFDMDEVPVASGKSQEWYTPAPIIEAARAVMGSIYLDPASCKEANQTVRAARFYTKEQNGLEQPWAGPLWLNPPFSSQALWSKKLLGEHKQGSVHQAIFLAQAATERTWFQDLWTFPVCFADHQIIFNRPDASPYHIYHGICFAYLGPNISSFVNVFTEFGPVVTPDGVHRRPSSIMQTSLFDTEK